MSSLFSQRLKELREARRLSQRDLAAHLGWSHSTVGNYESGIRTPDMSGLLTLAQFFGVTVSYLIGDTGDLSEARRTPEEPRDGAAGQRVPIVGRIRAGIPVLSEQNIIGEVEVPSRLANQADFALEVSGDSMINAGIGPGDIVFLAKSERRQPQHGDIVAAATADGEATLKWFMKRNGAWWLVASNPKYEPIQVDDNIRIIGVYVGMLLQRKPQELDPPPEDMTLEQMVTWVARKVDADPDVLMGIIEALAKGKKK